MALTTTGQSLQERAIIMLAGNIPIGRVADALGVTPARISQLLEDPDFKGRVANEKFLAAQKQADLDTAADSLEAKLLRRLDKAVDVLSKPMEIARVYQIVNAAKRRNTGTIANTNDASVTINLTMPTRVIANFAKGFQTSIDNQVLIAGGEELITMPVGNLKEMSHAALAANSTGGANVNVPDQEEQQLLANSG